jgi:hypothetical protein
VSTALISSPLTVDDPPWRCDCCEADASVRMILLCGPDIHVGVCCGACARCLHLAPAACVRRLLAAHDHSRDVESRCRGDVARLAVAAIEMELEGVA